MDVRPSAHREQEEAPDSAAHRGRSKTNESNRACLARSPHPCHFKHTAGAIASTSARRRMCSCSSLSSRRSRTRHEIDAIAIAHSVPSGRIFLCLHSTRLVSQDDRVNTFGDRKCKRKSSVAGHDGGAARGHGRERRQVPAPPERPGALRAQCLASIAYRFMAPAPAHSQRTQMWLR